ncbi:MAG TPA: FAD/NAD(P)-binding oxidoreductase [Anaerolineales bacterium]|nr:FAD/NAD(P)-binding oxidoreductase [Anaerolineales bacterium]
MKTFLVLGAGTAGTMVANKMNRMLDPDEWRIIIVDRDETHYYQPGFLFIPFQIYSTPEVVKPKRDLLPRSIEVVITDIERIEPERSRVVLTRENRVIEYDTLVIATGAGIHPEETEGMLDGGWRHNIFDFYTLEGAETLGQYLKGWPGGRLVVNIAEMPIKCPVAPLEFLFLADWYFHRKGMREKVELVYATPLPGAFTQPTCSQVLGEMLDRKGIHLETDFNIGSVDSGRGVIASWDDREIAYDLLVTVPVNRGAAVIGRSGLGDELDFAYTDKHTLRARDWENIWVIGDAANVPASKAGSVAHFMLDVLVENILRQENGLPPLPKFDGHANCFIESGFEKGILIDFNYDVEPLPGRYPLPGLGPFTLLEESSVNHWGKKAFRWVYWNLLVKGADLPISSHMSMAGKRTIEPIRSKS